MTSSTSTIDYRNTLVQYPTLTKIHGEPTAEAILNLTKEIKANARSVYSDLRGGKHGHFLINNDVFYVHYRLPLHALPVPNINKDT